MHGENRYKYEERMSMMPIREDLCLIDNVIKLDPTEI